MRISIDTFKNILSYVEEQSTIELREIQCPEIKTHANITDIDTCGYCIRTLIRDGYLEPFKASTSSVIDITMKGRAFLYHHKS